MFFFIKIKNKNNTSLFRIFFLDFFPFSILYAFSSHDFFYLFSFLFIFTVAVGVSRVKILNVHKNRWRDTDGQIIIHISSVSAVFTGPRFLEIKPSRRNLIHYEVNRMIYAHLQPPYSSFRVSSGLWSVFQYCTSAVYFAPGIKLPLQPWKMTFPALPVPKRFHLTYLL